MPAATSRMSGAEYLEWERRQTSRHEFHSGEVFAMAGGSPRHNALAASVASELRVAFRGGPCRVFSSDQRVTAKAGERYVYPDVTVACGPLLFEPNTDDVIANPNIVVEVLSRSTELYDRGSKWDSYQRIGSLLDYVLVLQSEARLEHFQRQTDGSWRYRAVGPGEFLTLTHGAQLSVDAVFEGMLELPGEERTNNNADQQL